MKGTQANIEAAGSSGDSPPRSVRVKSYDNAGTVAVGIGPEDPSRNANATARLTPTQARHVAAALNVAAERAAENRAAAK